MTDISSSQHAASPDSATDGTVGALPGGSEAPRTRTGSDREFHPYPFYSPRFWHGMRPQTYWGLLSAGRFRIHPTRIPLAIGVLIATPVNTLLAWMQRLLLGRQLDAAELHGAPIFIVGHWRSGTTLLHELMVLDERFSSASTFQCFAPHHFLVSEWFFHRFATWLLPAKRPMDNMAAGWDRPQEDEFALVNLGLPSPYRRMAFPNEDPVDLDYLNFDEVDEAAQQRWIETLRKFLLAVSYATGRPLVLKSPTHTGRIETLAKAFPDAKFIHITRDPRALFPSTCRLWRSLDSIQGFQKPTDQRVPTTAPTTGSAATPSAPTNANSVESYVIECLRRMYRGFRARSERLGPQRFIEVRYDELAASPVDTLKRIYESLHLADFEPVQPVIERWVASEHRAYQPNRHQLDPMQEAVLREAWKEYFTEFGYD